ncbi:MULTISPECIES: UDP-glucose 4-epimerase GalE [Pseudomonas]|uniref:UDP-glucose 4-epimerase n=1 Tax=Pseudomonas spirodelae TaxID=3101751 RepID=A0ABU5PA80_9PSED|nr:MULTISPECIES: UDP-glucose 4-epimerase GalE [unclassified Pseudomonas]MBU0806803.1 UDP-glucose 4-epimerase GalE [Gammaproteobacteria bacterium]MBU0884459.1 UDP-glucose 4-epimerase GalE [Gammaproteobacteria bacterium]MBU1860197.1 UDP-glucose 4-epimerase GalE [Gammaproteobacteria bacterium]MDD2160023.1 UDP-glucose 4-epimerase GalE [Pseudomonas sp. MIL19]MEA1606589.1 UDP-glucose 4-epimerase GalE [Pseudomonas sp. T5W1]
MRLLVTGGAGYIGSHTVLELLQAGHDVVVLDNLCNGSLEALRRIQAIAGRSLQFVQGDIRDRALLDRLFAQQQVDAVVHFAGLKAVGESVRQPLDYYACNVAGTLNLCQAMADAGVFQLVFSSSATVYGDPAQVPVDESCPVAEPTSPYGRSKLMVEHLLHDVQRADTRWSIAILRYFNPVGAHPSGLIGEDPLGVPNNLLPYLSQVAVGKLDCLQVHGNDYPTPDGTCIRDYIHVVDLAQGHVRSLQFISRHKGCSVWNLGAGKGYSVLQVISAFEQACGRSVHYIIGPRRPGDIAANWAEPSKAERELGWKAERSLASMMADTWRWQSKNPQGYR